MCLHISACFFVFVVTYFNLLRSQKWSLCKLQSFARPTKPGWPNTDILLVPLMVGYLIFSAEGVFCCWCWCWWHWGTCGTASRRTGWRKRRDERRASSGTHGEGDGEEGVATGRNGVPWSTTGYTQILTSTWKWNIGGFREDLE